MSIKNCKDKFRELTSSDLVEIEEMLDEIEDALEEIEETLDESAGTLNVSGGMRPL